MGSYFGAALCAVDINHDGCDDLLIGSPMYEAKIAMEGKVNVYISQCTVCLNCCHFCFLLGHLLNAKICF